MVYQRRPKTSQKCSKLTSKQRRFLLRDMNEAWLDIGKLQIALGHVIARPLSKKASRAFRKD